MQITRGIKARAQKVVIYGPEGIGKSSFAAQFPDPVFIDTEGSTDNMDVARLDKPSSWTMLVNEIAFIKANPHSCKTLVIDTIDWAESLAVESVCAQHGKKGIEDFGWGNGYTYVREEIGRFLNNLSELIDLGINVVLTAHAQIKNFTQPDEMGSYDRYELKLGKKTSSQTAPLVKEWADMVLFCNYETIVMTDEKSKKSKAQGGQRVMYTQHHPAWDAKNRHNLTNKLPLDYAGIAHIFNVQQVQAEPVPPTAHPEIEPPAPEQVPQQEVVPAETPVAENPAPVERGEYQEPAPFIDPALRDLMIANQVTEQELQQAVASKGYYPVETPISMYDKSFIDGALVATWDRVFEMVKEIRGSEF